MFCPNCNYDLSSHKEQKEFLKRVNKTESCWLWEGTIMSGGYGRYRSMSKSYAAHRYSYSLYRGSIPEGLVLDHLCRNRSCVNPDHLEAVTSKENISRGEGICAKNAIKRYCKRGHRFNQRNTYLIPPCPSLPNGGRSCRECQHIRYLIRKGEYVK